VVQEMNFTNAVAHACTILLAIGWGVFVFIIYKPVRKVHRKAKKIRKKEKKANT
jgi:hypothetical protein